MSPRHMRSVQKLKPDTGDGQWLSNSLSLYFLIIAAVLRRVRGVGFVLVFRVLPQGRVAAQYLLCWQAGLLGGLRGFPRSGQKFAWAVLPKQARCRCYR